MRILEAFLFATALCVLYGYIADLDIEYIQGTRTYKAASWVGVSLFCENGKISKGAAMATCSYLLFLGVTVYLVAYNINWGQYPTFAGVTAGGGTVLQLGNKYLGGSFGGRFTPKGGDGEQC